MQTTMPSAAEAELADALFQMVVTAGLALFSLVLYRRWPQRWFAWWAAAWGLYVVRLGAIVAFLMSGNLVWLFWHQVATGWVALAILYAALVFSRGATWRPWYAVLLLLPVVWAWVAVGSVERLVVVAWPMVVLMTAATLWTAWVFWRHSQTAHSVAARLVSLTFLLWGLHHLDYPLLRARGEWIPWGYFLDILFELAVGVGFGVMALSELATRLEARTRELGRLSGLMVRQQEAERRRLQRELHDETAQTLSAVKLEVGMLRERADAITTEGLDHVLALVDGGIKAIRRVMNDLRPALLDDMGLIPAIRSLADDVRERSALQVEIDLPDQLPRLPPEGELGLFRAAQEALANVIRHADASRVTVQMRIDRERLHLSVRDDGRGLPGAPAEPGADGDSQLGLAGMRERIGALGGQVEVAGAPPHGVVVSVTLPVDGANRSAP
jgi:signal transduction histidine kinase